jgi:hypothetical protein
LSSQPPHRGFRVRRRLGGPVRPLARHEQHESGHPDANHPDDKPHFLSFVKTTPLVQRTFRRSSTRQAHSFTPGAALAVHQTVDVAPLADPCVEDGV